MLISGHACAFADSGRGWLRGVSTQGKWRLLCPALFSGFAGLLRAIPLLAEMSKSALKHVILLQVV